MDKANVLDLGALLETIRSVNAHQLHETFEKIIPQSEYLNQLNEKDRLTERRACLLAWFVTGGTQMPRDIQLQSCLAMFNGKGSVYAGTGSGKMLAIALNYCSRTQLRNILQSRFRH